MEIDNIPIDVDFETAKRDDIIKQFFPQIPIDLYINRRKLPSSQAEIFKWMDNDSLDNLIHFCNFLFFPTEKNKGDIKNAVDKKYLPLCADVIISYQKDIDL